MPRRILLVLPALLALAPGGCAVVAVGAAAGGGAAAFAYYKGKVCDEYPAGIADTHAAVKTALLELHMPVLKDDVQQTTGTIESRTSDDASVSIALETVSSRIPAEGTATRVCVRVGTFGDGPVSNRIHDQISSTREPPLASRNTKEPPLADANSGEPPLAPWTPAPRSPAVATPSPPAQGLPSMPIPIQPVQHTEPREPAPTPPPK
jgi:hypothetical protein